MTITAWSYSRAQTYQQCPMKAKFLYIDRIPMTESRALKEGKRAHEEAEAFLNGGTEYPTHPSWNEEMWGENLRELKAQEYVAETKLAFDGAWKRLSDYFSKQVWVRAGFDASLATGPRTHIIDFKTGRFSDDHEKQAGIYALCAFQSDEACEAVAVDFWYLDRVDIHCYAYNRKDDWNYLLTSWTKTGNLICNDTALDPTPGAACGAYGGCQFASNKGGQCKFNTQGKEVTK